MPMISATYNDTLLERLVPVVSESRWLRDGMIVLAGSLLLTLSAKLAIPFIPVPLTLQTLVVLCLGIALGPRLGLFTVLAYLGEGALGLPVFAGTPEKGIGVAYMLGTTGGYLLGFAVAAFTCGCLARLGWDRSVFTMMAAMLIGNAIIYLFGIGWLGSVVGWDKPVLAWGMTPFLPGDAVKIVFAAVLVPYIWRMLGRDRHQ